MFPLQTVTALPEWAQGAGLWARAVPDESSAASSATHKVLEDDLRLNGRWGYVTLIEHPVEGPEW